MSASDFFPSKVPDEEIEDVAQHKGVLAAFVEKDLYVTAALWALAATPLQVEEDSYSLVFAGGTSLSKAYGLIERFSEDIDFRLILPQGFEELGRSQQKKRLSDLKQGILARLEQAGFQNYKPPQYSNANRSQHYFLQYQSRFATAGLPIRPYVQVEIFTVACRLPSQRRPTSSMWHQATGRESFVEVDCTDPLEIAAEKLSGLSWRMPMEARGKTEADPNLVRHIHDLAALCQLIAESTDFPNLARQVLYADRERGAKMPYAKRLESLLALMEGDPGGQLSQSYQTFVSEMSYANDPACLSYESASAEVIKLIRRVLDGDGV